MGRGTGGRVEGMAREILETVGSGASDGEKAMGVWRFVAEELYDQRAGLSWSDDFGDPVKLFNVYGFDGCIANAVVSCRLAEAAGLKAREIWLGEIASIDGYGRGRVCAHDIFEAYAEGDWRFLDTDQMVYFLKRDNKTVAGVGGSGAGYRSDAPVAPNPGSGGKGYAGEYVLLHAFPGAAVCVSAEQRGGLDGQRGRFYTCAGGISAAAYDGAAAASGGEAGALLGQRGESRWCGGLECIRRYDIPTGSWSTGRTCAARSV